MNIFVYIELWDDTFRFKMFRIKQFHLRTVSILKKANSLYAKRPHIKLYETSHSVELVVMPFKRINMGFKKKYFAAENAQLFGLKQKFENFLTKQFCPGHKLWIFWRKAKLGAFGCLIVTVWVFKKIACSIKWNKHF